jgi:hypothetical protein
MQETEAPNATPHRQAAKKPDDLDSSGPPAGRSRSPFSLQCPASGNRGDEGPNSPDEHSESCDQLRNHVRHPATHVRASSPKTPFHVSPLCQAEEWTTELALLPRSSRGDCTPQFGGKQRMGPEGCTRGRR